MSRPFIVYLHKRKINLRLIKTCKAVFKNIIVCRIYLDNIETRSVLLLEQTQIRSNIMLNDIVIHYCIEHNLFPKLPLLALNYF